MRVPIAAAAAAALPPLPPPATAYAAATSAAALPRPHPGDYVRLCQTSVSIVDTPPFQRLRYLKQLGMSGARTRGAAWQQGSWLQLRMPPAGRPACACRQCRDSFLYSPPADFVYPGATHTRFAHSLGVAHRARVSAAGGAARAASTRPAAACCCSDPVWHFALSCLRALHLTHLQELALRLKERQPELALTDSQLVVLEVAGAAAGRWAGRAAAGPRRACLLPCCRCCGWSHVHRCCICCCLRVSVLAAAATASSTAATAAAGTSDAYLPRHCPHPPARPPPPHPGRCHDLGHGPFSHAFESELVPQLGLGPGERWCARCRCGARAPGRAGASSAACRLCPRAGSQLPGPSSLPHGPAARPRASNHSTAGSTRRSPARWWTTSAPPTAWTSPPGSRRV